MNLFSIYDFTFEKDPMFWWITRFWMGPVCNMTFNERKRETNDHYVGSFSLYSLWIKISVMDDVKRNIIT
jgi:hypothetical protein